MATMIPSRLVLYFKIQRAYGADFINVFSHIHSQGVNTHNLLLQVQYLSDDELITNSTSQDFITITRLRPHRNYTFTVLTRAGSLEHIMRQSKPVSATFTTHESAPGKVRILKFCLCSL